tara:strand:- start:1873 stop:3051 length:1179 start_codon:yes stop_codon:yes gene_type:complete
MSLSPAKKRFVDLASAEYGEGAVLSKSDVKNVREKNNLGWPSWFVRSPYRIGKGEFKLPVEGETITPVKPLKMKVPAVKKVEEVEESIVAYHNPTENLVPSKDPLYVPFGNYNDVYSIIKSGRYYPAFVTGLSGNGKTFMIEQACAKAKREFFRVNITVETDEDDLLGHYALIDGNTVWQDGPVVKAMERGAILLLDEIDLASSKIMCLQPVLEGKGVFLKKVNRFVTPSIGFNVLATANTKGKGSEDGRFIGTNILNEAFLERFPITVEQEYPSISVEKKILDKIFKSLDIESGDFSEKLVTWADIIRKTFYEGGIDEIIATRRLVHIANAYAIFGDRKKAIQMCINRFDEDTKTSFLDLYSKVDSEVVIEDESAEKTEKVEEVKEDHTPF